MAGSKEGGSTVEGVIFQFSFDSYKLSVQNLVHSNNRRRRVRKQTTENCQMITGKCPSHSGATLM
jgi:hypothetical protein